MRMNSFLQKEREMKLEMIKKLQKSQRDKANIKVRLSILENWTNRGRPGRASSRGRQEKRQKIEEE
jgi:hypothetical protein